MGWVLVMMCVVDGALCADPPYVLLLMVWMGWVFVMMCVVDGALCADPPYVLLLMV